MGGLNNPCGPGAENVELVIVNTDGPPLPPKREHQQVLLNCVYVTTSYSPCQCLEHEKLELELV